MSTTLAELHAMTLEALVEEASRLGLEPRQTTWKDGLVVTIATAMGAREGVHFGCGVLEVHAEGFGFLRSPDDNFLPGNGDIYVSQSQIRRFDLRTGDTVIGRIRPPKESERYPALLRVESINADAPDADVTPFEELTPVHPSTRLPLNRDPYLVAVDWVAPMGLGQRGLLIASSQARRTRVLRGIADAFAGEDNFEVCVLLIGDRPEEITEWRETSSAEVIATPFDELPARHLQVAEIAFARAMRQAERGQEVILLVDSLTRLLRFCSAEATPSGRMIDGVDANALQRVRTWMAAARSLRAAGSLTVVGVVNGEDGNHADAVLRQDLGEVANWQLTLRQHSSTVTAHRPSIDPSRSWTRHEDLLVFGEELERRNRWRDGLTGDPATDDKALDALFRPAALDSGSQAGN